MPTTKTTLQTGKTSRHLGEGKFDSVKSLVKSAPFIVRVIRLYNEIEPRVEDFEIYICGIQLQRNTSQTSLTESQFKLKYLKASPIIPRDQ